MFTKRVIGIEAGTNWLRAFRLGRSAGGPADVLEMEWSSAAPEETVAALRDHFGTGARLSVAVDTAILYVKRLSLPALPADQRRRMVAVDPERYFPVRAEPLVAGVREDDLVVAAPAELFDVMSEALSSLGALERVEPAPLAVARHLGAAGVSEAALIYSGTHGGDCALVRIADHRVLTMRKVPGDPSTMIAVAQGEFAETERRFLYPWDEPLAGQMAAAGVAVEPVPAPPGGTEPFAGAHGAVLGVDAPAELTLASPALERRHRTRAVRRGILAVGALILACIAALWSLDLRRERTLNELERRIATQQDAANEVQGLLGAIADARDEVATLAAVSSDRGDPLEVLLLLTQLLPEDAHLRSLHVAGDQWELDGYARDAASLIPVFEASEVLADVRFRSATTRTRVGNDDYETFSLALRYTRPAE